MACNQYNVTFSIDEVITFVDCSGDTQTLSGKASTQYFVCSQTPPTIPALGVTSTDLGPATLYFFSSCCGNYFFNACIQDSLIFGNYLTIGSDYIQFNDGLTTTNKCFSYDSSVVPPIGVDIPLAVVVQKTGFYQNTSTLGCLMCPSFFFPNTQCTPFYYRYCCCDYSTPEPPMYCYFSIIGKGIDHIPGNLYYVTVKTEKVGPGVTFCAEAVDSSLMNFYSITEYDFVDDILNYVPGLDTENCASCTEIYPCPTPSPTPTPTVTPTPTRTPLPTPSARLRNECEPITIFDMSVNCVVFEPQTLTSNDGAVSLEISGGTPPYKIIWDNGNESPAIGNLVVGSYGATVVDFYGDFTAKTVCVLTGRTITPTPTPTPTPSPVANGPVFCFFHRSQYPTEQFFVINDTFSVDSYLNGQPSWVSGDGHFRIYWNNTSIPQQWEVSGDTPTPVLLYNSNQPPPSIPTNSSDWQIIGGILMFNTITLGPCVQLFQLQPLQIANPTIEIYTVKNDTTCGCDGSLIINADGGNAPYQYSIDNGLTYSTFPIFDDLCSNLYTISVIDSSGYTQTSQVTIELPQNPTTYVVSLSKKSNTLVNNGFNLSKTYEVELNVTPPLPFGSIITFDIIHSNNYSVSISGTSAQLSTGTQLSINGVNIPYDFSSTSVGTSVNLIEGCQNETVFTTGNTEIWQSLSIAPGDSLLMNTSTVINKNFTNGCDFATSDDVFNIANLTISGCDCCSVQNVAI